MVVGFNLKWGFAFYLHSFDLVYIICLLRIKPGRQESMNHFEIFFATKITA